MAKTEKLKAKIIDTKNFKLFFKFVSFRSFSTKKTYGFMDFKLGGGNHQ